MEFDDDLDLLSSPERSFSGVSKPVSGPVLLPVFAAVIVGVSALLLLSNGTFQSVVGYVLGIAVATVVIGAYRNGRSRVRASSKNFTPNRIADFLASATLLMGFGVGLIHGWNMAFDISAWMVTR